MRLAGASSDDKTHGQDVQMIKHEFNASLLETNLQVGRHEPNQSPYIIVFLGERPRHKEGPFGACRKDGGC